MDEPSSNSSSSSGVNIENGVELFDKISRTLSILPTGSESLDELLDGGVWSHEVTEIVGDGSTGKTQLCLSLAATITRRPECYTVVYLDSHGTNFRSSRLREILLHQDDGLTEQEIDRLLELVVYCRVNEGSDLLCALERVYQLCTEKTVRLVILDSIDSCLYESLLGDEQIEGREQLAKIGRQLKLLARDWCLAVVVVNHMVYWQNLGDRPALGQVWANMPHTRLIVTKTDNQIVRAQLDKSVKKEILGCASFQVGVEGVSDIGAVD